MKQTDKFISRFRQEVDFRHLKELFYVGCVRTNNEYEFERLNKDIRLFPQVIPVTPDMKITHKGVSRLVMLDRYTFKDTEKSHLLNGDFVVLTIKEDPKFPARGLGFILRIDWEKKKAKVLVEEEFRGSLDEPEEAETGVIERPLDVIEKPLEIYYEQIAKRNATGTCFCGRNGRKATGMV